ncbi:MAG TPA: heparinase II/III family protein [Candidatus Binataceae bacterium]|nr:heparinase II/III family protein [Candidatus Binataceae bacterium]
MPRAQPEPSEGPDVFESLAAARPRLMATAAAIARSRHLVQRNATARLWQQEIANQADYMLWLPPLTPNSALDPQEANASALPLVRSSSSSTGPAAMLDIARRFCLRIQVLAITWFLTDDTRYRDRAKTELLAACAFPDWAGNEFLVTAEFAFGAAIGLDWLHDSLDDGERAQVASAIIDKAIQPGLDQFAATPPPPQHWMTAPTNWNLVCNGALMIAALSVAEQDERTAQLFALCLRSIRFGFEGYNPDGGWVEGPGYWHYATQYAIYLLASLATALGNDLGLDASWGLSRTGLFRLHAAGPSGKLFNFADSEEQHSGGYWLFWLAKRYDHPIDAWIEKHRGPVHPMDLLWFDDTTRPPSRLPPAKRFHGPEVAMLRGGWNEADTFLGIKGGANDSCRHAHYDLGSFVLDALGVRWAVDLGPDDYGLPYYFSPLMRSEYYRTSTIGHNTLVLDGQCQPATAEAPIIRSRFRENLALAVIDLSGAYPATVRALRGFALIARRHVLIVDEIWPNAPVQTIDWQMHTRARVDLAGPIATLTRPPQDGGEALQCYLRPLESSAGRLSVLPASPSGPPGQNSNTDFVKLVLRLEKIARPVRLAVLISPDLEVCARARLPAAVRRPLIEWAKPLGRSHHR